MAQPQAQSALADPQFGPVIEPLASQIHEGWMQERRAQGWAYGERRDDSRKQHPCLVAYDRLPESEKELDRRAARTAIAGLVELGYAITKRENAAVAAEAPWFAELRRRLNSKPPPELAVLHVLWQQCRELDDCPADLHLRLGELILKLGEPILAYDALSRGLARAVENRGRGPDDQKIIWRLKQLLCLALAQSGAAERARLGLEKLCGEGHDTPETLGLLGRVHKDLALRAADAAGRKTRLNEAFRNYQRGFEKGDSAYREHSRQADAEDAYYCGINAAAVSVLRGELETARTIAGRVGEICESLRTRADAGYWLLATLGEAELIQARYDQARQWYGRAVEKVGGNWRELTSTRRQTRLLAQHLGVAAAEWDALFQKVAVAVFTSPAWTGGKMPEAPGWHEQARQILESRLHQAGVIAGYLGALSPADILFGECLLDRGAEVHIVLPYPRDLCRAVMAAEPAWQRRLDRLLAGASSVIDDTERSCLDESVNLRFAGLRLFGSGCLRANRLDADLHLWSCEQGPWPTSSKPEYSPSRHCHHPGCAWESILPAPPAPAVAGTADDGSGGDPPASSAARAGSYEIKAMLFADVKGYSKLNDASLFRFSQVFLQQVAQVLDRHEKHILSRRTAGDGLFLVINDVAAAAEVAFGLREMMGQTAWAAFDLPPQLGIRISLEAGPVYVFHDLIVRRPEVCGASVNRAARIEPITPPNEVYASEAFVSLYVAAGAGRFRFDYVGQTQLPKGFGLTPLYCLLTQATQTEP